VNTPDPKAAMHAYLDLGFLPVPWHIGKDGRKIASISGFHYRDYSVTHADIEKWPKAQAGLAMCQRSGFWTLDFDCTWERVTEFYNIFKPDKTAIQVTGRGYHMMYHGTGGCAWPRDGIWSADWPDVQVRSCGFVAAAPSWHPNGRQYRWTDWPVMEPGTLLLGGRPERVPRPGGPGRDGGPDGDLAYYAEHGIVAGWQDTELYRLACRHVRSMSEGELFDQLWKAACASVQNPHNPWRPADIMSKIRNAAEFTSGEDKKAAETLAMWRAFTAAGGAQ
jgi:hypothetical protein